MKTWLIPAHAGKTPAIRPPSTRSRAHPRSRGENLKQIARDVNKSGSSPLTRGKPADRAGRLAVGGLIPAHAGKTFNRELSRVDGRAHPRSRGENQTNWDTGGGELGSSPLTRGKHCASPCTRQPHGLIPAHAGKTLGSRQDKAANKAHPRSRGENSLGLPPAWRGGGSSPLTRGKPHRVPGQRGERGLIPAHAGKTSSPRPNRSRGAAHPRSRGENSPTGKLIGLATGSSPLTRGKHAGDRGRARRDRLIPAHAGKTGRRPPAYRRAWAHPRSRGENLKQIARDVNKSGSSPLTRGKLRTGPCAPWVWRLIPAHAGKTSREWRGQPSERAHPRSRGENVKANATTGEVVGSSPLTRGKHGRWWSW